MKEFILKYWLQVLFGLAVSGIGVAYKTLSKRIHKQLYDQKALKDGTQALLRNQIIKEYDKYTSKGSIPIYGMENVNAMYSAYHALGGNGTITKILEELKELPSREVKEHV